MASYYSLTRRTNVKTFKLEKLSHLSLFSHEKEGNFNFSPIESDRILEVNGEILLLNFSLGESYRILELNGKISLQQPFNRFHLLKTNLNRSNRFRSVATKGECFIHSGNYS